MKKIFLIGLAATAMLASCSNDETVEMAQNTKAIGFSSFIDKSTRATDTDLTNLATIEVYGWRGDAQIFDKQEVTVEASGVVKGIEISDKEGTEGGSGFDVDVEDWGDYEDIELPL